VGAIIVTVLTFVAGALAVFAFNLVLTDLAQRDRKHLKDRLRSELRQRQRVEMRESTQFKDLSKLAAEAMEETEAESATIASRFTMLVSQSGLNLTPARLLMRMAIFGAVFAALTSLALLSVLFAAPAAALGALIPMLYVAFKRHQRIELLRSQLSDCFELISRVLMAGQTMSQAMQSVADEFKPPVATEFGMCFEQQNLGLAPDIALRELARRTGLLEIKIFVLAVMVHRQTGGNLTELLDKLALIVRERFRIRGMISSLTAEGRMQAVILLAMPPLMFVVLLFTNRVYAMKLFDHPELPIAALISMAFGALWIRKIVNFDF
jgi:tight adherence protein B